MGWILYFAVGVVYAGYLTHKNNWDILDEGGLIMYTIFSWPIVFLFRLGKSIAQRNNVTPPPDPSASDEHSS